MGSNIFVRLVSLPVTVRAVTLPNPDCTFDIYINKDLPEELQHSFGMFSGQVVKIGLAKTNPYREVVNWELN